MTLSRAPWLALALSAGLAADGLAQGAAAPLSLPVAIDLARAHSPTVRAAHLRADAEIDAARAAGRWRAPTLDLSIENLGPQDLDHDGFVWFTQSLDLGARRSTRLALAAATRERAVREVDARRRDLDLRVVDVYLSSLRASQAGALLEAHEATLDELVRLVARRVTEGVAAEGDLHKLEVERTRTGLERRRLALERRQHLMRLGTLIGLPGEDLANRLVVPVPPPVESVDIETALAQRPDLALAAAQVEERRRAADAERALGSAAFAATGGYKRTAGLHTATAGVSIDLPIGQRNRSATVRAQADAEAARLEYEQGRLLVRQEIEHALVVARALADEVTRIDDTLVTPADYAQRAARAAFREGTGDALAVVDADRVWLAARRDALDLRLDAVAAAIQARVAAGQEATP